MPAVDNFVIQNTGNVSLSNAEAGLFSGPIPVPGLGPGRVGFIALLIVNVPNVTALTAPNTVTVNVRSGTSVAGTLIGSLTTPGATAMTNTGVAMTVAIPAGVQSVFVGAILSAATGTAQGSATAPIQATLLVLD